MSCFTFGKVDLVTTIEEYTALLRCSKVQVDRIYSKAVNVPTFLKKLINITGMSEQWVAARIKQKGDSRCIPWKSLRDLILAHLDVWKKVDVFALSIYGLIVFPKILGHIDEAVTDLFDRLDKGVTPVLVILAKTFWSLNVCRRTGEGRFIGCAQLLLGWFHSHFWKVDKVSYQVFSESYSPLKEIVATFRRDDITEEKWMAIFQNLQEENVEWRAPWLLPDDILYWCGDFDWVPLLGIWGAVGYAPLLVLRQYRSRQFVPATQGLSECGFSYKDDGYKRKAREMANAWNQTRRMKRLAMGPMTTSEYNEWRETEGLRKGKRKVEEDLNSLKTDYKRLRLSVRTAGLGKTSEQWHQEVQEEKTKAGRWEERFQEAQMQNRSLEKMVELQASLSRIEKMKKTIEELEVALQNGEARIEYLEANKYHQSEQLHYLQNQVRSRDRVMGQALVQI
ncbi:uncharacterized protein [Gossypium hirsutum]|uniref:DUF7745 domain-containing protein n=1 Tax=Gossypium hirsutum TaxID=3635 RepID=A0ABM2ZT31_GOSHI|nr:uncharacterized protein LOC121215393 [Gossypium hirsutum]